jgi:vancomycin resistance protein YoaR
MEKYVNRDIIYEGISIEGTDVGGLTKAEASDKIKEIVDNKIYNREIRLYYKDKSYVKPYKYFEFQSNYEKIIDDAYKSYKSGKLKERYYNIKKLQKNKIDYSVKYVYNERKIEEFLSSIKNDFNIEPKNAIIHRKNNMFIIDEEIVGLKLDMDKNSYNLKNAITNCKEELKLVIDETNPQFTKKYYSVINNVLGEYSTSHNNNVPRTQNLIIACKKINGTVLEPGEDLATHDAISPIDVKNGYKSAPIIISGEVKDGLGGGVCQVATTLYNAVLYSELNVIERRNHSMPVSYIEKGKDATMSGNHIDFVFENSTNYPIYIESYVRSGKLVMRIFGKDERSENRKLKFQSDIIQRIHPPKAVYVDDNTLYEGETKVKRKAINGYKVKLYKLIYVDNKLIKKELVNSSYYKPVGAIIKKGKKKTVVEDTATSIVIDSNNSENNEGTKNTE